jgi:hypothetical protein
MKMASGAMSFLVWVDDGFMVQLFYCFFAASFKLQAVSQRYGLVFLFAITILCDFTSSLSLLPPPCPSPKMGEGRRVGVI